MARWRALVRRVPWPRVAWGTALVAAIVIPCYVAWRLEGIDLRTDVSLPRAVSGQVKPEVLGWPRVKLTARGRIFLSGAPTTLHALRKRFAQEGESVLACIDLSWALALCDLWIAVQDGWRTAVLRMDSSPFGHGIIVTTPDSPGDEVADDETVRYRTRAFLGVDKTKTGWRATAFDRVEITFTSKLALDLERDRRERRTSSPTDLIATMETRCEHLREEGYSMPRGSVRTSSNLSWQAAIAAMDVLYRAGYEKVSFSTLTPHPHAMREFKLSLPHVRIDLGWWSKVPLVFLPYAPKASTREVDHQLDMDGRFVLGENRFQTWLINRRRKDRLSKRPPGVRVFSANKSTTWRELLPWITAIRKDGDVPIGFRVDTRAHRGFSKQDLLPFESPMAYRIPLPCEFGRRCVVLPSVANDAAEILVTVRPTGAQIDNAPEIPVGNVRDALKDVNRETRIDLALDPAATVQQIVGALYQLQVAETSRAIRLRLPDGE